jgi:chemotaxis-related protein WspD
MIDCWNTVGVRGDGSCPELARHAHCRNCEIYSAAAVELLRSAPRDSSLDERTTHLAQPKPPADRESASAFVFRIGDEWLALPTHVISEIANPRSVHTLPHKTADAMLGVTNIRGQLVIAMSLGRLLGLAPTVAAQSAASRTQFARLLVLRRDAARIACPVDEVHGVVRFGRSALRELPATLARAGTRYSTKLLAWNGRSVGVLDDQLLFYSLKRSIA